MPQLLSTILTESINRENLKLAVKIATKTQNLRTTLNRWTIKNDGNTAATLLYTTNLVSHCCDFKIKKIAYLVLQAV